MTDRLPLPVAWLEQRTLSCGEHPIVEWWATRSPSTSNAPRKNLYTADQMHAYSDACNAALREINSALCTKSNGYVADNARLSERVKVLEDALRCTVRELQACQSVIHLAGGFDPAYVSDAQVAIKAARAALEKTK